MRIDKSSAMMLRREGKSYNEISKQLNIPKSTLNYWFKNNIWSESIKNTLTKRAQLLAKSRLKLMSLANKSKWERWHSECREEAKKEFPYLKNKMPFVAGLMLYWGEGDKILKNGQVRLVNSNPQMINIFYYFLHKSLNIPKDKIHFRLTLYPELVDKTYKKLWGKQLGIPLTRFGKSVYITGRHPNKRLSYGMCSIEVYSRKLKEKIVLWIDLYQKNFQEEYLGMI